LLFNLETCQTATFNLARSPQRSERPLTAAVEMRTHD